jgi:hypothetical protein
MSHAHRPLPSRRTFARHLLRNAAMILGGEGPVSPMRTAAGKWFSSFYALFGGVVFISPRRRASRGSSPGFTRIRTRESRLQAVLRFSAALRGPGP